MMIMIVMMMQTLMVESEDTTENLRVVVVVAETHQRAPALPASEQGKTFDKKAVDKWLCHPRNPLLFAENNLAFKSFRFTRNRG